VVQGLEMHEAPVANDGADAAGQARDLRAVGRESELAWVGRGGVEAGVGHGGGGPSQADVANDLNGGIGVPVHVAAGRVGIRRGVGAVHSPVLAHHAVDSGLASIGGTDAAGGRRRGDVGGGIVDAGSRATAVGIASPGLGHVVLHEVPSAGLVSGGDDIRTGLVQVGDIEVARDSRLATGLRGVPGEVCSGKGGHGLGDGHIDARNSENDREQNNTQN